MRVAVLWPHLSGYMNACLCALAEIPGTDLFVSYQAPSDQAPFAEAQFSRMPNRYRYETAPDGPVLLERLRRFQPDVLLVCSWHIFGYRFVLRRFSAGPLRVLCMDNPWLGTMKQWLGVLTASRYLNPLYDVAFVPGEPQAVFARKLGFTERRIWRGLYCCDHGRFAPVYRHRAVSDNYPAAFIFVGRLSHEKGIDILAEAYRAYRAVQSDPWPLIVCGTGPLRSHLDGIEGVRFKGFLQPDQQPSALAEASCLILPSLREPWGVVIHEATAAGLAVIATAACGAAVHLVQDGYNGYVVEAGSVAGLREVMRQVSLLSYERRKEVSAYSFNMSLQYTPSRWASYVHDRTAEMMAERQKQGGRSIRHTLRNPLHWLGSRAK